MMMSRKHYAIAIITGAAILGLLVAVVLVGCGGGDSGPAASTAEQSAGEVAVEPSAGPDLGDMDSNGIPTGNDAQLIMNVVVDPDSYDLSEKWIADCDIPEAAAGEIPWPFGGGPPPPPLPGDSPPPPPPI